jgi:hypothetical protein
MLYISYGSVCEIIKVDCIRIEKDDLSTLNRRLAKPERKLKMLIMSSENKPLYP